MTTKPTKLEQVLQQLAQATKEYAPIEARQKQMKALIDELRFEALGLMTEAKSRRTDALDGYYLVRTDRVTPVIEDEGRVIQWLVDNHFDPGEYRQLNAVRVKALAEAQLKETGEILPGVGSQLTSFVSVKEVKK